MENFIGGFIKPIILLDIDGVVNTIIWGYYPTKMNGEFCAASSAPQDGFLNNYQAICWLNYMYKMCPYDIVITSRTWRDVPKFHEYLYKSGLDKEIKVIGKTPEINNNSLKIVRGMEIKNGLSKIIMKVNLLL